MQQLLVFCIVACTQHYLGWGIWIWWVFGLVWIFEELASLLGRDSQ